MFFIHFTSSYYSIGLFIASLEMCFSKSLLATLSYILTLARILQYAALLLSELSFSYILLLYSSTVELST